MSLTQYTCYRSKLNSGQNFLTYDTHHKSLKQTPFLMNFLQTFLHSLIVISFSLKCAPLPPQCWATHILEHWDDGNTQINIGEGETHTSVSRFLTSILGSFSISFVS